MQLEDQATTTETSMETTTEQTSDQSAPASSTSTTETAAEDESLNLGTKPEEKAEEQPETKTEEETPNPLFGAPAEDAAYDLSAIELPEGMTVDTEALEAVAPTFRELNLSNEGAARVAQAYAEKVVPLIEQRTQAQLEQRITAQRAEWEGQARDLVAGKAEVPLVNAAGDKLGFETTNIKQVQTVAARALDQLAPQGFRKWLDETGLGVHPNMIAFAYQAGLRLTEDREVEPSEGAEHRELSRAEKYYGRR